MKTSTLIRKAKQVLWNGTHGDEGYVSYICCALDDVTKPGSAARRKAEGVQEVILSRLATPTYQYVTLRMWLAAQLGVAASQLQPEDVQRHRLQWMDMLAAEFEAKGD